MKHLIFLLAIFLLPILISAQNKVYYKYNNIRVEKESEAEYYGIKEYPIEDSNKVILTKFYMNGKPMSRTFYYDYQQGIKHNIQMMFYPSGNLAKSVSYNFDTLQGPSTTFDKKGAVISKKIYLKGEVVAIEKEYSDEQSQAGPGSDNFVEYMPIFEGCETIADRKKRESCSVNKIFKTAISSVDYPVVERDHGVSGILYLKFTVNEEGFTDKISIIERRFTNHSGGKIYSKAFDNTCIMAVYSLPQFIPGTQYGEAVEVQYTMPFKFNLRDASRRTYQEVAHYENGHFISAQDRGNQEQGVDKMPIWVDCNDIASNEARNACTELKVKKYLDNNIEYPNGVAKTKYKEPTILRFTVDTFGKVNNAYLLKKSRHSSIDEAIINAAKSMPNFSPAELEGKPMSYEFIVVVEI